MSSFSLLSFIITLMLAAAACTHGEEELVKDSAGNFLRTTEQYLIRPVLPSNGGGLVPAPIKSYPLCPLGISQASTESIPGIPVSFAYPYPFDFSFTYVYTLEALNIEFKSDPMGLCKEFSKLWEVDETSSASKEPAILVGGKQKEQNSWFIIEKKEPFVGNAYKLTTLTGTIGTVPGPWENSPQLVVTNDTAKTFFVKFDKVSGATTATTTTPRVEKFGQRMFPVY